MTDTDIQHAPDAPRLAALDSDPAVRADPYPLYARLRQIDPVHWEATWGQWVLTRYSDVAAALGDSRLSAQLFTAEADAAPAHARETATLVAHSHALQVLFLDPPAHTRVRTLLAKAFTPRSVEALRPRIQAILDELLAPLDGRHSIELMREIAYPLPAIVIAELLGVPRADREQFKAWSVDMATDFGVGWWQPAAKARAQQGIVALLDYIRQLVRERKTDGVEHTQGDLLSILLSANEGDATLSEEEVVANAAFLLFAGHETTTNLVGNGLLALLRHPGELTRLRADPLLMPSAVEELLRYDTSIQFASRVAKEDISIRGKIIVAGQRVRLGLGSANHDPEQFADPDQLDITRRDNRHLSFTHGIHFCLGAALARLEAQVVFSTLLARFPRLELMSEAVGAVEWSENADFRGLQRLTLVCA